MTERELGRSGPKPPVTQVGLPVKVSAIGLGCMGMSDFYDPKQRNSDESVCHLNLTPYVARSEARHSVSR